MFKAILIQEDKTLAPQLAELDEAQLPEGDVLVDVEYTTLNYKDALSITRRAPIARSFPMVPGIDLAGAVATSTHPDWAPGDQVILNGHGVSETFWGGFAQKARVRGDWLVPLPAAFTTRQATAIGTAGYTAALSVEALVNQSVTPDQGPVLVTGATGGVGSIAIILLARAGFEVAASTGKASEADYLKRLGAATIIDRDELSNPGKPLQKERWAGVVDSLGSATLANACAQTKEGGVVTACGLAQGMDFTSSVAPFILRGVTLIGIESVRIGMPKRRAAWARLARDLDPGLLDSIVEDIGLLDALSVAGQMLDGRIKGCFVVDVNG